MAKHNFMTSVRNGDQVQGDTRPSEIVTYRLSAAEVAALYGPPGESVRRKMALDISKWQRGGNKSMTDKTKTCRKCGVDKPSGEFRPGWAICNDCREDKAVDQAVKDYAAQHGISLEATGGGHMIEPAVVAVLGLLDEARRYRVAISVEEA